MSKKALPNNLHICLVAQKFPILGRATDHGFLWPIARGLAQRGHHVTVLSARSPIGKYEVDRDGVKVYYLHEGNSPFLHLRFEEALRRKFIELNEKEPFHIVHCMDRTGIVLSKDKHLKVPVAFDVAATNMSQVFSILGMSQETVSSLLQTGIAVAYKFLSTYLGGDRELLRSAAGVFVTAPLQRIFLERYYLYPDDKTYTVPYGAELGDLSQRPEAIELRKKYKLPENAHVVLTITDMQAPRELSPLLVAFERVAVKKPYAYLVMVGNGPAWNEIEFEMLNLALSSRVIMTGALKSEELSDFISIADVFVSPGNRSTGFDPVTLEAMAQKKIVIGSEISPLANILDEGQDGFLIRPADHESLAQLLIAIFSGNIPVVDIGERAREKVLNLFDARKMISSIEQAYFKILSQAPKSFLRSVQKPGPKPPSPGAPPDASL